MFRWLFGAAAVVLLAIGMLVVIAKLFVDCEKTENRYAYFTCAVANPKLFIDCRTRFQNVSDIDWIYVRSEVAKIFNKRRAMMRPEYNKDVQPEDVRIDPGWPALKALGVLSRPLDKIVFEYYVPNYAEALHGFVNRCGIVDIDDPWVY